VPLTDFVLNLAALLVWLSWRSRQFDPLVRSVPITLIGTLRRAEPHRLKGGHLLLALVVLLLLRALLYQEIGSPAGWTPKMNLGLIVLAFRSDRLSCVLLYSLLSFLRVLLIFYFWLLVLVFLSLEAGDTDPVTKLLRLHLGRLARLAPHWQLILPALSITFLWVGLHPLLLRFEVLGPVHSVPRLFAQGALLGLSLFFTLKYLLPVFLFLHLVASYVYLGHSPVWDFVSSVARNLLKPLQPLPLQFAKLDLAPIVGVALIFLLLHWVPNFVLWQLEEKNLTLWPQ